MNVHWERWINASIGKAIKALCDASSVSLYVETSPRATDNLQDWVELRVNGPMWQGGFKDEWMAEVEINIFILSKANQVDNHRLLKNIGLMRNRLSQPIPVLKLGNSVDDDQSYITCLKLDSKDKDKLKVNQLGQVTGTTPLMRATVDGMFFGNFNG